MRKTMSFFYYRLKDPSKETLDLPLEIHNVSIEVSCIPYDGAYLGQISCIRGNKYTLFAVRDSIREYAYNRCSEWLDSHYILDSEKF